MHQPRIAQHNTISSQKLINGRTKTLGTIIKCGNSKHELIKQCFTFTTSVIIHGEGNGEIKVLVILTSLDEIYISSTLQWSPSFTACTILPHGTTVSSVCYTLFCGTIGEQTSQWNSSTSVISMWYVAIGGSQNSHWLMTTEIASIFK